MQTAELSPVTAEQHERVLRSMLESDPDRAVWLLDRIGRDPLAAHHAYVCRGSPELLRLLAGSLAARTPGRADVKLPSAAVLVARAAKAMARWSATGFRRAPAEQVAQRWNACTNCPHLAAPPATVLHQLTSGAGDGRVCRLCGCTASQKVRIPTERCPDRHPADAGLTRWGEPVAA